MKKILNLLAILSFQIGYLAWGHGKALFVFQGEIELFKKAASHPLTLFHPIILIPFIGQILLVFTLFQKEPGKTLTFIGVACLAVLMLLLLFIGVSVPDFKILTSALPFIAISVLVLRTHKKQVV
jgi:peptidoglycan/LPS O-acetylase OafA/YrhL